MGTGFSSTSGAASAASARAKTAIDTKAACFKLTSRDFVVIRAHYTEMMTRSSVIKSISRPMKVAVGAPSWWQRSLIRFVINADYWLHAINDFVLRSLGRTRLAIRSRNWYLFQLWVYDLPAIRSEERRVGKEC